VTGPGHGGPGLLANVWLEGTYSEVYPSIGQDADGMQRLFRQFSFPGGVPSHAAPETPGSIHEGGELGYSLLHAYGAAFDNPDLVVACVVGDGEAETGALATSWHSNKFLNPSRDGAVIRSASQRVQDLQPHGPGPDPRNGAAVSDGGLRIPAHRRGQQRYGRGTRIAGGSLAGAFDEIDTIQTDWRTGTAGGRPRWPMLVLRTPKGWTGPER